jgi:hypothetical protein
MRHLMIPSAVAMILLGGCGDSAAPNAGGTGFDAAALGGNAAAVRQVLDDDAWQSLQTLGPRFGAAGAAAGIAGQLTADIGAGAGVRIAQAILLGGRSQIVAPQLPLAIRGTTFVLDSVTLEYVADSTRSGAPATGVRFLLYETDPASRQPLPEREIGYADLTDEADAADPAIALRLQAAIAGATRLDYHVVVVGTGSATTLLATGYTDAGATRVAFRIGVRGVTAADTAAAEVTFAIGIPAREFQTTATLQHLSLRGDSIGTITLTARQGNHQVGMAAHVTLTALTAIFQVDGHPFATVQGDPDAPVVQGVNGQPLSADEVDALLGIHHLSGRMLEIFDCLMQPVGGMLGFGS